MLCFVDGESCYRGNGMLGDRNADKNNTNNGESLVFAATEAQCPTQPALQFCTSC